MQSMAGTFLVTSSSKKAKCCLDHWQRAQTPSVCWKLRRAAAHVHARLIQNLLRCTRLIMCAQALVRPGRFDRVIKVGLPDAQGRKAVLSEQVKTQRGLFPLVCISSSLSVHASSLSVHSSALNVHSSALRLRIVTSLSSPDIPSHSILLVSARLPNAARWCDRVWERARHRHQQKLCLL